MSIRDELLDHAARERYGSAYTEYPQDHPITRSLREEVARVVDPILARFGVVELPEPDEAAANGAAGWDLPMWEVVTDAPDYVTGTSAGYWAATPGEVRAYAAALLAAAKRVEAKS